MLAAAGLAFAVLGLVMGAGSMLLRNEDGRLLGGWLSEINWDADYIEDELGNISSDLSDMTRDSLLPEDDYVPAEPDGDTVTEYPEIREIELDVKNLAVYVGVQDVENVAVDISNLPERYRDNIQVSGETGARTDRRAVMRRFISAFLLEQFWRNFPLTWEPVSLK